MRVLGGPQAGGLGSCPAVHARQHLVRRIEMEFDILLDRYAEDMTPPYFCKSFNFIVGTISTTISIPHIYAALALPSILHIAGTTGTLLLCLDFEAKNNSQVTCALLLLLRPFWLKHRLLTLHLSILQRAMTAAAAITVAITVALTRATLALLATAVTVATATVSTQLGTRYG